MVRIAGSQPAGQGSIPGEGELFFEVIFILSTKFFLKYNQFDLIKWTISITFFNVSIKPYELLNIFASH